MEKLVLLMLLAGSVLCNLVRAKDSLFDPRDLVYGKRLEGYVFRTFVKVSARRCWDECKRRPKCRSFNYVRRLHLCELNCVRDGVGLTASPGSYFGSGLEQENGVCGQNTCSLEQTCDTESSICKIQECPLIEKNKYQTQSGNINSVGAKVILDCEEGFTASYNLGQSLPVTLECTETSTVYGVIAKWSLKPFHCIPVTCKALAEAGHPRTTREYKSFDVGSQQVVNIFCDFESTADMVYTFFSTASLGMLTTLDAHYDVKDHVIVRHLTNNNFQKETVVKNLLMYRDTYNLTLLLNNNYGFNPTACSKPYLYLGFIPTSFDAASRKGKTQGYEANDEEMKFVQCDENLSSQIVICENLKYTNPCVYYDQDAKFVKVARDVNPSRYMRSEFFYAAYEIAFGGCGTYLVNTCFQGLKGISFGLPSELKTIVG